MNLDKSNAPEEHIRFRELCEKVGLALMLGQKVHFALSYYHSVFGVTHGTLSKERAKQKLEQHLSTPMGNVINSINREAPLCPGITERISEFKESRNWLAHDFDQEATPFLARGKRYDHYICKMEEIATQAYEIMQELHLIGEQLVPVGVQDRFK